MYVLALCTHAHLDRAVDDLYSVACSDAFREGKFRYQLRITFFSGTEASNEITSLLNTKIKDVNKMAAFITITGRKLLHTH